MTTLPEPLSAISSEQFDLWQPGLKVIAYDHARRFAALTLPGSSHQVALSWRSDLVEPVVLFGKQSELWLGVDQHVVCLANQGRILFSVELASALLQIKCFRDCVAILCETEVVLVNADHSIRTIHDLADIPDTICEREGAIAVTFGDGREEIVAQG